MMTSNSTTLAWIGCLALSCSSPPNTEVPDDDRDAPRGGYTGLAKYTGISGTYGNGTTSSGGATGSFYSNMGGTTFSGTSVNGTGGVGVGGAANSGGTSSSTGDVGTTSMGSTQGGTAAQNTGGSSNGSVTGGAATGGKPTIGGAPTGGAATGGTSSAGGRSAALGTGGATSNATGGTTATSGTFTWPGPYDPAGAPTDPTGKHNPGTNCIGSACHATSQASRALAFGGTVYQAGTTTPAANVQIAVTAGGKTVVAYSANNGNFWLPLASASTIDWTTATVHLRNGKGERAKAAGTSVSASCNNCHGSSMRITAP